MQNKIQMKHLSNCKTRSENQLRAGNMRQNVIFYIFLFIYFHYYCLFIYCLNCLTWVCNILKNPLTCVKGAETSVPIGLPADKKLLAKA